MAYNLNFTLMIPKSVIKRHGEQRRMHNFFLKLSHEMRDDFLEFCHNDVF